MDPTTQPDIAAAEEEFSAAAPPDPDAPGKALLPFELSTGRVVDDVWAQWLDWDPVRLAPSHADALRSMKRIYLDAGNRDEYFLDLGAEAPHVEERLQLSEAPF